MELSRTALEEAGFDGLYCVAGDPCGCENSDLAPCGEGPSLECKPGYKHLNPLPGHENEWAIFSSKIPPREDDWRGLEGMY